MTDHDVGDDDPSGDFSFVDPELAALAEQITRRLQAGERVLVEDYIARYPLWADSIRRLFPAMRDLVRLGERVTPEHRYRRKPETGLQCPDS
jgi:hypothetical protein